MSARIYSLLLSLYPAELRHDFGAEMTQVFLEDLEDSYRNCGFRGVARVWWRSFQELLRIALPAEVSKREIAVPIIVYFLQEFYMGGLMFLAPRGPHADMPTSPGQIFGFLFVPGLFSAIITSVALRIGNRSIPVPLNLGKQ